MSTTQRKIDVEDQASMPTARDFLATDRGTPPAFLFERSTEDLGNDLVATDCYTSRDWHDREVERIWKRVWQAACRENDIPTRGINWPTTSPDNLSSSYE